MSRESKVAFYKATKFWILLLIALILAAVLVRTWHAEEVSGPASHTSGSA